MIRFAKPISVRAAERGASKGMPPLQQSPCSGVPWIGSRLRLSSISRGVYGPHRHERRTGALSRDGGRTRKSRGRGGFDDEAFGSSGEWSPPLDFGRAAAPRHVSSGFGQESQATVKWFKADKGFGFVEIADGGGDAFLHASVLERAGANIVEPGAILRVRTGPGQKGLQVTEVLEIAAGTAPPRPSSRSTVREPYHASPSHDEGTEVQGNVKWYSAEKGFGFVAPADGGKDVFVHATALQRSGIGTLSEGQSVRMHVVQGRKGPEVSTISAE
jgi:CspA family cold shock protein